MNVTEEKINGFNILFVKDERIDAHNSADLKDFILHMIEQGQVNLIVQMENVRFVDSSGLGALLSGLKHAEAKSGKLSLSNLQNQVLSMFELTRLNRVFEIYADLNEVFDNEG
ncbi:MAG: STAS domain-containing protein [Methylococcaceae bacterium]|nr:STAS domain-containing protein [Methylococcaceae bacterium]